MIIISFQIILQVLQIIPKQYLEFRVNRMTRGFFSQKSRDYA